MYTFLIIVHVVVSVAMIAIVLLQAGKGASIGASFGAGASGAQFGPTGPAGIMGRVTAVTAAIFMLTSLTLAVISGSPSNDSIMPATMDVPASQPASQPAPAGK